MKILFSGYHNPHFWTITEYVERAILAQGHELHIFDDRQYIIPGRIRKYIKWLHDYDIGRINKELIALAMKTKPDIAIVTGGHRILSKTISKLKSHGVVCILWTIDPPRYFQPLIGVAPSYDYIFCQGTEAIELLAHSGVKGAKWLPMACDPDVHHPIEFSLSDQKKYVSDLVFVGSYYPDRAELFEKIVDFNLSIWGPGWDTIDHDSPLRSCIRGAHANLAEWLKIYNASKIILATHYHDPQNRFPVYQASPRVFEALACGSFVLCDAQRDVFSLFQDGIDLVKFVDITDLRNKIDYFLTHPKERAEIAITGRHNVVCNHTYQHRIKKLLSHVGCEV